MSYRIEDKKRNLVASVADMSEGLRWLKRHGKRGDVLRNTGTGRILAKAVNGYAGRTYDFLKDAEAENGNSKLHELTRGTTKRMQKDRRDG